MTNVPPSVRWTTAFLTCSSMGGDVGTLALALAACLSSCKQKTKNYRQSFFQWRKFFQTKSCQSSEIKTIQLIESMHLTKYEARMLTVHHLIMQACLMAWKMGYFKDSPTQTEGIFLSRNFWVSEGTKYRQTHTDRI